MEDKNHDETVLTSSETSENGEVKEQTAGKPEKNSTKKRGLIILLSIAAFAVIALVLAYVLTRPLVHYKDGIEALDREEYKTAVHEFEKAGNYKDANEKKGYAGQGVTFVEGSEYLEQGKYLEAVESLGSVTSFPGAEDMLLKALDQSFEASEWDAVIAACDCLNNESLNAKKMFALGMQAKEKQDYENAISCFEKATEVSQAEQMITECRYGLGTVLLDSGEYETAYDSFVSAGEYLDAQELAEKASYLEAQRYYEQNDYANAISWFEKSNGYSDADSWISKANYETGKSALSQKKYAEAIEYLEKAGKTEDAETLLITAKFEFGKEEYAAQHYDAALTLFNAAKDREGAEEWIENTTFELGKDAYSKKRYQDALNRFNTISEKEGVQDWIIKTKYELGKNEFSSRKYDSALNYLNEVKDYEDAQEWISRCKLMQAENLITQKKYSEALEIYRGLPSAFSYNSIVVSDRVKSLELYEYFVQFEGKYECTYGYREVRQTGQYGIWHNWYNEGKDGTMSISVSYNPNGTVSVSGKVSGYAFYTWSILSSQVKTTTISASFSFEPTSKSMPRVLYEGNDMTIKYTGGKNFAFSYLVIKDNEDIYFTYKYATDYRFIKK